MAASVLDMSNTRVLTCQDDLARNLARRRSRRLRRRPDEGRAGRDHLIRYGGEFSDLLVEHAAGSWLTTEDGRRILDFTSGQMCATLGHGHPAILEAMREASGRRRAPVQRLPLAVT